MLTEYLLCVIIYIGSEYQNCPCRVMEVNKKPLYRRNLKVTRINK